MVQKRYDPSYLGIWWFTKIINQLVGENYYDAVRVERRILSNKFYYIRQQMLYRTYTESPDVANMIGIYPKTDSSHGYGNPSTSLKMQSPMRCTVTFRRTASTVTALSVCG
jgi:hypothetical protein